MSPTSQRLVHLYGPNVHILSDLWARSVLARIGHPNTDTPELHRLIGSCYRQLLRAMTEQFPTADVTLPTRMTEIEPRAAFTGSIVDPDHRVVVVDVARAGMMPSYVIQESLFELIPPKNIRVDHVYMQRVADSVTGAVTGTELSGSKIGGGIDEATVLIPDPMGATGGSLAHVMNHYLENIGTPRRFILAHLMITPEYIKRITTEFPTAQIYALRLDRGLSTEQALATVPGTHPNQERGLTDKSYIVPGAGGVGELLNNAFV